MRDSRLGVRGDAVGSVDDGTSPESDFRLRPEDERTPSLEDVFQVVWRRLWVIMLVAAVLAGAVIGFDLLRTPTYEASIKILVGQERGSGAPSGLGSEVQGLQQLTQTMAEAVGTRPVATEVIRRLGLEETPEDLLTNVTVEQVGATQFIEVSYENSSPRDARLVADTIGEVFSERVSEVSPSASDITVTVWEGAAVPDLPSSPNPLRDGLVALVLGGLLGVGLAFLLEYLDDRWRSPEEVEQVSGVPTFGVIPEFKALEHIDRTKRKGEDG